MKKIIFISLFILVFVITSNIYSQIHDWGDAPDTPYPTLAVNNGAAHLVVPGMMMGIYLDAEFDGQPNSNALGDDYNFQDDADGVIFNSWLIAGQNASVLITVTMPGLINAWIDFNADGDWKDSGEQIFVDANVYPGTNNLSFSVPNNIASGMYSFARIRYSTAGGMPYDGIAPDGEVEDYQLLLGSSPTGDIYIDPDPSNTLTQNEISLAVIADPEFGMSPLLIAAYNDEPFPGGPGLGISYSTDAGGTWSNTHLTYPQDPFSGADFLDAFDPTICIDDSGHVFVGHISTDNNWMVGPASGLYVHKSVDSGVSWQAPVQVAADGPPSGTPDTAYRLNDRDQIISDNYSMSPYYNNIYITWIKDRGWQVTPSSSDIYFSYSTNGGASFSNAARINELTNNLANMPVPDVAKNGTVYVVWMHYNVKTGGQGVMFLDRSTDGGKTFGQDIVIDTIDLPPINMNGGSDVRAKGAAVLKVLPSDTNMLFIVYAADPDGAGQDEGDIFLIKSKDGGNSWSNPKRVNDDAGLNDQVMPWMYIKPNGIIDMAWYDRRNDPADLLWNVYYTSSIDSGNTFAPNVKVNMASFASPAPVKSFDLWMGEYLGLAADYNDAFFVHNSSIPDANGDLVFQLNSNPKTNTDWGDAPDPPYPTYAINDGARHKIDGTTFLGTYYDEEPDALPGDTASGDDMHNTDDEDGVLFPDSLVRGNSDTIKITANTSGIINAWFDFNSDGDWDDADEYVLVDLSLSAGVNDILLTIPDSAEADITYARFRFASYSGLSYSGSANDGEVEDYRIVIYDLVSKDEITSNPLNLNVWPNPFKSKITLEYTLTEKCCPEIVIYDINGKLKEVVSCSDQVPGNHQIHWNTEKITSGIYFCVLRTGVVIKMKKIVKL